MFFLLNYVNIILLLSNKPTVIILN
ncbi:hypothetical protein JYU34_021303 [Plutella xylostella]|uniref:Uncharacterized protein n=1 Tax=Plutella xylostella TaxID=51655 RepID=A0ABQ7PTA1_PLUXY|nr:hypothetical protein JYU34_021303 [Plutella xylostella]